MNRFFQFCAVGGVGFVIDATAFTVIAQVVAQLEFARVIAFWVAIVATFLGNHMITYGGLLTRIRAKSLLRYFAFCHVSGFINIGVFMFSLDYFSLWSSFLMGVLAGLFCNYYWATRFVFQRQTKVL